MKKIILIALIASTTLFTFIGCEKEESSIGHSKSFISLPKDLQILYGYIPSRHWGNIQVIGDGILRFESEEHLDSVLCFLQKNCEIWDDLFLEHYSNLSEQELEILEDSLNYNEFQPLIEFENTFKISNKMLRDQQQIAIDRWYNNGMYGDCPIDPIIIDNAEQTLYSTHHEICVGDTIAQYRNDGSIILIPISHLKDIDNIRNQSVEKIIQSGQFIVKKGNKPSNSYTDHVSLPIRDFSNTIYLTNVTRSRWILNSFVRNCFLSSDVKIKTTMLLINEQYKNGKWKKVRRNCSVVSALNYHYVLQQTISNPPTTIIVHTTNTNLLFGNTLPAEKFRKQRSDNYYYPTHFPHDYVDLGIGKMTSKFFCTIDHIDKSQLIFN